MTSATNLRNESGADAVLTIMSDTVGAELGGDVTYTRFSALVGGLERRSLSAWFFTEAEESMVHAQRAAEILVTLGSAIPQHVHPHRLIPPWKDRPSRQTGPS